MRSVRQLALTSFLPLALALSACGGGGSGSGLNSTPTPTPTPPPSMTAQDPIIATATTSQDFAVLGAEFEGPSVVYDGSGLSVRYNAATGRYEVSLCCGATPVQLMRSPNFTPAPGSTYTIFEAPPHNGYGVTYLQVRAAPSYPADRNYSYSNLAVWSNPSGPGLVGATAFGIPTPVSAVPTTGTATYGGFLEGWTDETYFDLGVEAQVKGGVTGDITLAFDFGAGSLTGSLSATLHLATDRNLGTFTFTDTAFATADRRYFLGALGTPGSSFGGQFTGPAAQELIGQFRLPYISPVTESAQTAAGAFIAKRP